MNLSSLLRSAEGLRALDRPAAAVARAVRSVFRDPRLDGLVRGAWLGHPVHPVLVTLPIGAWVSAAVLDIGFGQETAARRLQALGLVATPPTVVTGLADFSELDTEQRRVGVVHAASNAVSAACVLLSCLTSNKVAARALHFGGLAATVAGGALGGHLAYAQGAGVRRWEAVPFERHPPVTDTAGAGWEPVPKAP